MGEDGGAAAARRAALERSLHALEGEGDNEMEDLISTHCFEEPVLAKHFQGYTVVGDGGEERVVQLNGKPECEGGGVGNGAPGVKEIQFDDTGVSLWPAAELLTDYLAARVPRAHLRGVRCVELGCGLGLCGLVVSAIGGPAARVVLTDGRRESVDRVRGNVRANHREGDGELSCRVLTWGDGDEIDALRGGERFDVVVGSDLIFDGTDVPGLMRTAAALLAGAGRGPAAARPAWFLLSFQRRALCPVSRILACAQEAGLEWDVPAGAQYVDLFGGRHEEPPEAWTASLLRFSLPGAAHEW